MSSLKITLFGSPCIECDGVPLKFDTRKNTALIAYLAVTRESHTREALITLLWPESDPSRARAGFRRNLSVLKKAFAGKWLVVDGEIISLATDAELWLDVDHFRSLLASFEAHDHLQTQTCPVCITALAEAVELYREDFMAGFSLRDSPNFDEWQFFQSENLRQELACTLERLVSAYRNHTDYQKALPYAWRWLALDNLNEPAHCCLMQLYAWSGQWAAALRQYEECKRVLEEELGAPPDPETTQLYERIKSKRELPPWGVSSAPVLQEITSVKHNLPTQLTPFVGREREMAELSDLLALPDVRLVTILGAGGMGKTRLALETAAAQIENFTHGVYLIPLGALQSVDSIVPTVAEAMGFSFYERGNPAQQLLDFLRHKIVLLIMDNFEHLLEGVDWTIELLKAAPEIKVLATSRTRLNVQGEHLYPLAGMDLPTTSLFKHDELGWEEPQQAAQYSAIQLFLQGASHAHPDFGLSSDNFRDVVRICRMVQGMPLAILLAAAWVEVLTPAEITTEIAQSFDFLATDFLDVPARHRSLRAIFDHSWRLLAERDQTVCQALSVFRGGFTRQAAVHIVGASLWELKALVNKSLLNRVSAGRYEMHELLRQFVGEKLEESPDAYRDASDQHAAYYSDYLAGLGPHLKGPKPLTALAKIEVEIENIRTAWVWAAKQNQVERLETVIEGLCFFYLCRMRYQEGEAVCRLAAQELGSPSEKHALRILAKILMWQGCFNWRLGHTEIADQQLHRSLKLLKGSDFLEQDTQEERASALLQLGHINFDLAPSESRILYEQSLAIYRALGDRWGIANALSALSWAAWGGGAYDTAESSFQESLEIRQALDDQRGIVDSLSGLANMAMFLGQFEEAERLFQEGRAIIQKMAKYAGPPSELLKPDETRPALDEYPKARTWYRENVGLYSDLGFSHSLAPSNSILGFVMKHLGQYEKARLQGETGLILAQQAGWQQEQGLCLELLGEVALAEEAFGKARQYLQDSVTILRMTHQLELSEAIAVLGYAMRGLGQIQEAKRLLAEALRIATKVRTIFPIVTALPGIALLLVDQGEIERALELYALALRYPRVANSRWFEDIAGRQINAAAAGLAPDALHAAQARAQSLELETSVAQLLEELGG